MDSLIYSKTFLGDRHPQTSEHFYGIIRATYHLVMAETINTKTLAKIVQSAHVSSVLDMPTRYVGRCTA